MGTEAGTAARRVAVWISVLVAAALGTIAAGIAVASALSGQRSPDQWASFGNIGESFGAISAVLNGMALAALVVTFRLQYQELRLQRIDSREQNNALISADTELHRTAEASLRLLHLEILKLSIQDADLAAVWPPFDGDVSDTKNRQFLYANAIFQYQWTALRVSDYEEADIVEHFRFLFTSPLMREYWRAARTGRQSLRAGGPEQRLSLQIDRLCEQYDTAATLSGQRAQRERSGTLDPV